MSSWIDAAADKAHQAIDWLRDLAARGSRRGVRILKKSGDILLETSLTNLVLVAALAFFLLFPVAVLTVAVGWLLGFRLVVDPPPSRSG